MGQHHPEALRARQQRPVHWGPPPCRDRPTLWWLHLVATFLGRRLRHAAVCLVRWWRSVLTALLVAIGLATVILVVADFLL